MSSANFAFNCFKCETAEDTSGSSFVFPESFNAFTMAPCEAICAETDSAVSEDIFTSFVDKNEEFVSKKRKEKTQNKLLFIESILII